MIIKKLIINPYKRKEMGKVNQKKVKPLTVGEKLKIFLSQEDWMEQLRQALKEKELEENNKEKI
jgi:hypothetical protein